MKPASDQKGVSSKLLKALAGIGITCLSTFGIWVIWFYIREEVMGNRDDLIALGVQTIICAALLVVGCGASIVYAFFGGRRKQLNSPPSAGS